MTRVIGEEYVRYIAVFCVLLVSTSLLAKKYGYIANKETAIRIGRGELIRVYGRKQIGNEEPLTTGLKNGIWTVWGTLWCSDGKGGRTNHCVGGVATITIRQSDGKVLSIWHTK